MDKAIVLSRSPFLFRAHWFETPKKVIPEHWITKEYGFEVFNSSNNVDRFVYVVIKPDYLVKATPEFLDDTELARLTFERFKKEFIYDKSCA